MYLQVDCDDDDTRYAENRAIIGLVVLVLKVVVVLACHDIKRYLRKNCLIFIFHCRTQIKKFSFLFSVNIETKIC